MNPLRDRTYRTLFTAQVIALTGTGVATVALGLLAYQLAGARAGAVLGTALALKMVTYVVVSPLVGALRLSRKRLLVTADLVRAGVVLVMPWVDQVWQVYVLVVALQTASAAFTPTFQSVIPDVLSDEQRYTRALGLAQLASSMENLLSPALAALALTVISFHGLFAATAVGFVCSAVLVLSVRIPLAGVRGRFVFGFQSFAATPRLRGLLWLNLSVAAVGSVVLVDTVVLVRDRLGGSETQVALVLAANGAGTMVAALLAPRLVERFPLRAVMLTGAALAVPGLLLAGVGWSGLALGWAVVGVGSGLVLVPIGRVLRMSSHADRRPTLFATQFCLSHACWLVTYPVAGWLGAVAGLAPTMLVLACVAGVGVVGAWRAWPADDREEVPHRHDDLDVTHPHLAGSNGWHTHRFVIDAEHVRWPVSR